MLRWRSPPPLLQLTAAVLLMLAPGAMAAGDFHWGYFGDHAPEHWGDGYSLCKADNRRQSPIDIPTVGSYYDETLDPIDLLITQRSTDGWIMKNNGHSVTIQVPEDTYVEGGSLGDVYKVAGLHFHWGSKSAIGSEHTINRVHYPLEMHIVTYDSERHDELGTAVDGDNTLAVLGTMFEVGKKDNPAFQAIIEGLKETKYPDDDISLPALDLKAMLPKNLRDYYRYEGSLTTPPCFESVVWTVFETKQTISKKQLAQFRQLKESIDTDENMVDNWRPVQKIQRRKVFRSFRLDVEVVAYYEGRGLEAPHSAAAPRLSPHLVPQSLLATLAISIIYWAK